MTPVDPVVRDYEALAARIRAAAAPPLRLYVIGQQGAPGGGERLDLYLVRVPAAPHAGGGAAGGRAAPTLPWRVYLNGGTHGDEPAGAEAVTRFLESGRYREWPEVSFTVTPCLNPWGYAHDRREGPGGRDLNRAFRRAVPATPEVGLIKRALRRQRFDLFLDCHEDVDAPGLYVFAPRALGRAVVEGARPYGPVHPGPAVDGEIPLKDSVVELDDDRLRERRRAFTSWPLPFYVGRYHRRALPDSEALAATIETPAVLPLEQRVAMHLAGIDAALRLLTGRPSPAGAPVPGDAAGGLPGPGLRGAPHAPA